MALTVGVVGLGRLLLSGLCGDRERTCGGGDDGGGDDGGGGGHFFSSAAAAAAAAAESGFVLRSWSFNRVISTEIWGNQRNTKETGYGGSLKHLKVNQRRILISHFLYL